MRFRIDYSQSTLANSQNICQKLIAGWNIAGTVLHSDHKYAGRQITAFNWKKQYLGHFVMD